MLCVCALTLTEQLFELFTSYRPITVIWLKLARLILLILVSPCYSVLQVPESAVYFIEDGRKVAAAWLHMVYKAIHQWSYKYDRNIRQETAVKACLSHGFLILTPKTQLAPFWLVGQFTSGVLTTAGTSPSCIIFYSIVEFLLLASMTSICGLYMFNVLLNPSFRTIPYQLSMNLQRWVQISSAPAFSALIGTVWCLCYFCMASSKL